MGSPFDLRATVREVLDSTRIADPGLLADEVVRQIPKSAVADVLRITLREYVRVVIGQERMKAPAAPTPQQQQTKATRINHWSRVLNRRECVAEGVWKLFADLTRDDLLALAEGRRQQAQQLAAKADHYDRMAKLVEQHHVERVGDLPEDVLREHLEGAE